MHHRIRQILPAILIIKILLSGFGWCGHMHHEHEDHEHYNMLHAEPEAHHDHESADCGTGHHDENDDHCKCRCICLGSIHMIPPAPPMAQTDMPLYTITIENSIYICNYIPSLDHPPRI